MADLFYTGGATATNNLDVNATVGTADTGDLRRKYNFGDKVSELALSQDPFFRFVSKVAKRPTDDPHFKFTEKRPSWMKRYAYVSGWIENDNTSVEGSIAGDADITAYNDGGAPTAMTVGDTLKVHMSTDFKSDGNVQNIYGQTGSSKVDVGSTGTRPTFFMPDQVIKIPLSTTDGGGSVSDFLLAKITNVLGGQTVNSRESVLLTCSVVRIPTVSGANYLAGWTSDDIGWGGSANDAQVADIAISTLEGYRSYVVGNAHAEGSGYPETWKDQPFTTGTGVTQIWKTSMAMTNSARATVLRYEGNEWARIWKEKLIEHKYDIEQSLLFGAQSISQDGSANYTQGAVDYVLGAGNIFDWSTSKTADDFLDDMSNYLDPRYNSSKGTVFFCSTQVYNWLHKLGGYFKNNLEISTNFSADLAVTGRKKVLGLDATNISTPYGDMNVVRNIHLDGTHVDMLAINLSYCKYRPLVGNGVNRDTSVYVGVQTLENSGVDRRVDQILTEAGMEWSMPECHAIWKS